MKRTKFTDEETLTGVTLPEWGKSYTVVSHHDAIRNMRKTFGSYGFGIVKEQFKSAADGKIATGTFTLDIGDESMRMMVGFINSYNKQVSFRYGIGANISICDNMNVLGGTKANYRRAHRGNIDKEAFLSFDMDCRSLITKFQEVEDIHNSMREVEVTKRTMAELCGRLFLEEKIITSTQLNIIAKQIEHPSYNYGTGGDTLYDLYQHATHAGKSFHPADYLQGHQKLSDFFITEAGILVKNEEELLILNN